MEKNVLILITICIIIVSGFLGGLYIFVSGESNNPDNNFSTNNTNITNNNTENVTNIQEYYEEVEQDPNEPVRELVVGSLDHPEPFYNEKYADGHLRQYDEGGKLIYSDFPEDEGKWVKIEKW